MGIETGSRCCGLRKEEWRGGLCWSSSGSKRRMLSAVMDPSQEVCQQVDKLRTNGGREKSFLRGISIEGQQSRAGKAKSLPFSRYLSRNIFRPGIKYRHIAK